MRSATRARPFVPIAAPRRLCPGADGVHPD